MLNYLKNITLVLGGLAVVVGGIVFVDRIRTANTGGGTASVFDIVGTEQTQVSASDSIVEDSLSPAREEEVTELRVEAQPESPSSNVAVTQNEPLGTPSFADAVNIAAPQFISFTTPIGPLGGGGGSSPVSPAPTTPVSALSEVATSSARPETVASSTPTTTIVIEVTTTSTPATTTDSFVPLSLCILATTTTSSVIFTDHLVISRILADNEGADTNEFIEISNTSSAPVSLAGWSLQYLSGGATSFSSISKKNFLANAVIESGDTFLVGMGDFSGTPDMRWSQALNNTGATIFLVQGQTLIGGVSDVRIVDRVAYGTGAGLRAEGEPAILPPVGQVLTRKNVVGDACTDVFEEGATGYGCDTNNNVEDFFASVLAQPTPPVIQPE